MNGKKGNKLSWSNLAEVEFVICLLLVLVLYWGIPFVTTVTHPFIVSFSSGSSSLFSSYCSDRALLPECLLQSSCLSTSFLCRDNFREYHQSSELIYMIFCLYSDIHVISCPHLLSWSDSNFTEISAVCYLLHCWPFLVMTGQNVCLLYSKTWNLLVLQINLQIMNLLVSFFGLLSYTGIPMK